MSNTLPKVIRNMGPHAPRYLHVPSFDVELDPDSDPNPRDRFVIAVEVFAGIPKADVKLEKVYTLVVDEDGAKPKKVDEGRRTLSERRWLYEGEVVPGSGDVTGYEEEMTLFSFDGGA